MINDPKEWPEDLRWALAAYLESTKNAKYPDDAAKYSPRFIVTQKGKLLFWGYSYPNGWDTGTKPFGDRLAGPEYARL